MFLLILGYSDDCLSNFIIIWLGLYLSFIYLENICEENTIDEVIERNRKEYRFNLVCLFICLINILVMFLMNIFSNNVDLRTFYMINLYILLSLYYQYEEYKIERLKCSYTNRLYACLFKDTDEEEIIYHTKIYIVKENKLIYSLIFIFNLFFGIINIYLYLNVFKK
jgi:hypothetical protein